MDTIDSVFLNRVEIQQNGIIRNEKGRLIGRLIDNIDYEGEHIKGIKGIENTELEKYKEALIWCGGSEDFQLGGRAREGWEKICLPLINN